MDDRAAFDWSRAVQEIAVREGDGAVFRLLWNMLHGRVFIDAQGSGYAGLSEAEKTIWVVDVLLAEIQNGGFHQFFSNSSGDHAPEVLPALEKVHARAISELYRRATKLFDPTDGIPMDRDARDSVLDAMGSSEEDSCDAFEALDREFHDLDRTSYPDLLDYAYRHSIQVICPSTWTP